MPSPDYSTQEPVPETPSLVQPRQRLEANRYYTPIAVELYVENRLRNIKWFPDLQLAHMWCMEEVQNQPEEDWISVRTRFPQFADEMDIRWQQGHSGKRVAYSDSIEYRVHYEPYEAIDSELLRNEEIDE